MYYVYIMTNRHHNVLYVGVTNNLLRRVDEHKNKTLDGFTSRYNINKLVYYEATNDIRDAIMREKQIKGWVRQRKNDLVSATNPQWVELSLKC